ncbi:hypothetical protein QQP08_027309 [Theobroma cacao]|nr:hypothetical protein QQP08_027309 [Theobroma cacao]
MNNMREYLKNSNLLKERKPAISCYCWLEIDISLEENVSSYIQDASKLIIDVTYAKSCPTISSLSSFVKKNLLVLHLFFIKRWKVKHITKHWWQIPNYTEIDREGKGFLQSCRRIRMYTDNQLTRRLPN